MFKRVLSWFAVIGLIAGSAWLGHQQLTEEPATIVAPRAAELGYSARDAEIVESGDDGRPLYTLNADTIRQRPKDGVVELHKVRMNYRGETSNQWMLTAAQGVVREDNERIELLGNVRTVGVLPGMSDLAQIFTEQLMFDPHSEIASTDVPVRMQMHGCQLDSTGLTANFKDQTIQLESHVHGSCS